MPGDRRDDHHMVEVVGRTIERLGLVPDAICADAAYGNGPNSSAMYDVGIRFVSPPQAGRGFDNVVFRVCAADVAERGPDICPGF